MILFWICWIKDNILLNIIPPVGTRKFIMTLYFYWRALALEQGSPTSRPQIGTPCQISGNIRLEIKCTINIMCLNHPPNHLPQSFEKLSPMKLDPGAEKVGDRCSRVFTQKQNGDCKGPGVRPRLAS